MEPIANSPKVESHDVDDDDDHNDDHKEVPDLTTIHSQLFAEKETFSSLQEENVSLKTQIENDETNALGLKEKEQELEVEDERLLNAEQQKMEQIESLKEKLESLQRKEALQKLQLGDSGASMMEEMCDEQSA